MAFSGSEGIQCEACWIIRSIYLLVRFFMKNLLSTSFLSATLALSGCSDPGANPHSGENLSSIHSISPEEANKKTGIMYIQNQTLSSARNTLSCNYARVEYTPWEVYTATAEHCASPSRDPRYQRDQDVIIAKHIEETIRKISGNSSLLVRSRTSVPQVLHPSVYDDETIVGQTVTIVGCFPDGDKFWCYTITWPVYKDRDERFIFLDESDFQRIFRHNTDSSREGLNGMSGSPVIGPDGGYVGTLSRNYLWKGHAVMLGITLLADRSGNIKNIQ